MSNALSEWVKGNAAKAERTGLAALFAGGPVVAEEKIKGRRVFLWNSNERTVLVTKHNGIYSSETVVKGVRIYAQLFKELEMANATILDCELWPERYGGGEPTLYVFDVLFAQNIDVRGRGLFERKKMLPLLVRETEHVRVLPFQVVRTREEAMLAKADVVAKGGEGLVLKADAPYGRPGSWVKDKNEETVDCFVTGFGKGAKGETTYFIGVHDKENLLAEIATAAVGDVKVLGEVYSAVNGVDRNEIKEGTVLEVRFSVVGGELMFPGTILRLRDDKKPEECLADQWGNGQ